MTYYRLALGLFLIGNVAVFTLFMRNNGYPWDAFLIFVGVLYVNAPVVVSFLTAQKIDEALKGHWLNWMNIAIPTLVCGSGLLAYVNLALEPGAHRRFSTSERRW